MSLVRVKRLKYVIKTKAAARTDLNTPVVQEDFEVTPPASPRYVSSGRSSKVPRYFARDFEKLYKPESKQIRRQYKARPKAHEEGDLDVKGDSNGDSDTARVHQSMKKKEIIVHSRHTSQTTPPTGPEEQMKEGELTNVSDKGKVKENVEAPKKRQKKSGCNTRQVSTPEDGMRFLQQYLKDDYGFEDALEGWRCEVIERPEGASVPFDRYWYSPNEERFRSRPAVAQHLNLTRKEKKGRQTVQPQQQKSVLSPSSSLQKARSERHERRQRLSFHACVHSLNACHRDTDIATTTADGDTVAHGERPKSLLQSITAPAAQNTKNNHSNHGCGGQSDDGTADTSADAPEAFDAMSKHPLNPINAVASASEAPERTGTGSVLDPSPTVAECKVRGREGEEKAPRPNASQRDIAKTGTDAGVSGAYHAPRCRGPKHITPVATAGPTPESTRSPTHVASKQPYPVPNVHPSCLPQRRGTWSPVGEWIAPERSVSPDELPLSGTDFNVPNPPCTIAPEHQWHRAPQFTHAGTREISPAAPTPVATCQAAAAPTQRPPVATPTQPTPAGSPEVPTLTQVVTQPVPIATERLTHVSPPPPPPVATTSPPLHAPTPLNAETPPEETLVHAPADLTPVATPAEALQVERAPPHIPQSAPGTPPATTTLALATTSPAPTTAQIRCLASPSHALNTGNVKHESCAEDACLGVMHKRAKSPQAAITAASAHVRLSPIERGNSVVDLTLESTALNGHRQQRCRRHEKARLATIHAQEVVTNEVPDSSASYMHALHAPATEQAEQLTMHGECDVNDCTPVDAPTQLSPVATAEPSASGAANRPPVATIGHATHISRNPPAPVATAKIPIATPVDTQAVSTPVATPGHVAHGTQLHRSEPNTPPATTTAAAALVTGSRVPGALTPNNQSHQQAIDSLNAPSMKHARDSEVACMGDLYTSNAWPDIPQNPTAIATTLSPRDEDGVIDFTLDADEIDEPAPKRVRTDGKPKQKATNGDAVQACPAHCPAPAVTREHPPTSTVMPQVHAAAIAEAVHVPTPGARAPSETFNTVDTAATAEPAAATAATAGRALVATTSPTQAAAAAAAAPALAAVVHTGTNRHHVSAQVACPNLPVTTAIVTSAAIPSPTPVATTPPHHDVLGELEGRTCMDVMSDPKDTSQGLHTSAALFSGSQDVSLNATNGHGPDLLASAPQNTSAPAVPGPALQFSPAARAASEPIRTPTTIGPARGVHRESLFRPHRRAPLPASAPQPSEPSDTHQSASLHPTAPYESTPQHSTLQDNAPHGTERQPTDAEMMEQAVQMRDRLGCGEVRHLPGGMDELLSTLSANPFSIFRRWNLSTGAQVVLLNATTSD